MEADFEELLSSIAKARPITGASKWYLIVPFANWRRMEKQRAAENTVRRMKYR